MPMLLNCHTYTHRTQIHMSRDHVRDVQIKSLNKKNTKTQTLFDTHAVTRLIVTRVPATARQCTLNMLNTTVTR